MDCFDKEEEEDDMEQTSLAERLEKKTGIKSPTSKVNGEPKTEAAAEKPAKKKQGQCLWYVTYILSRIMMYTMDRYIGKRFKYFCFLVCSTQAKRHLWKSQEERKERQKEESLVRFGGGIRGCHVGLWHGWQLHGESEAKNWQTKTGNKWVNKLWLKSATEELSKTTKRKVVCNNYMYELDMARMIQDFVLFW